MLHTKLDIILLTIAIKQPWDDSIIVNTVAMCRFPQKLAGKKEREASLINLQFIR